MVSHFRRPAFCYLFDRNAIDQAWIDQAWMATPGMHCGHASIAAIRVCKSFTSRPVRPTAGVFGVGTAVRRQIRVETSVSLPGEGCRACRDTGPSSYGQRELWG